MVIVHSYCSYKLSQGGFVYGSFAIDNEKNGFYYLSDKYNDDTVNAAFINGNVSSIYGKIPSKGNQDRYILLRKKLRFDHGAKHNDFGKTVNMNFAFEFDNYPEFNTFFYNVSRIRDKLSQTFAEWLIPDNSVDIYRLKFDAKSFNRWINKMLEQNQNIGKAPQKTIIKAISENTDFSEEFNSIFHFPTVNEANQEVEIGLRQGQEYEYPKKKFLNGSKSQGVTNSKEFSKRLSQVGKIIIPIMAALIIIIIISIIILM